MYQEDEYQKKLTKVQGRWSKIEKDFFENFHKLGIKSLSKYICYISIYGMQGSYRMPNELTVRASKDEDFSYINETIAHEILHLVFEKKLKKAKIKHLRKEGFIDYIIISKFKKLFPRYKKQDLGLKNKDYIYQKIIK